VALDLGNREAGRVVCGRRAPGDNRARGRWWT